MTKKQKIDRARQIVLELSELWEFLPNDIIEELDVELSDMLYESEEDFNNES